MEENETEEHSQQQIPHTQPQGHREGRQCLVEHFSWRHSAVSGYLVSPFLMGIALLTTYIGRIFEVKPYISGGPFSLVAIIVALLWGVRPALFTVALGFATHYLIVLPFYGSPPFTSWSDVIMYGPWLLGQLVVMLIVVQRERAQQRAIVAEREVHLREKAEALAYSNQQIEQLNRQFERENQIKDIYFSQASHELKTPLTTIQGQTQLALHRLAKLQETASGLLSLSISLEKIEKQTHHLHTLIDDLLDTSSLSSGRIPLRLAPCHLGNLCREVVTDQQALSGRRIELELPLDAVILQADCQRLTQVIINLVTNALKYSPEDSVVRTRMSLEFSHVIIAIHNDDHPIPQEQQMHIFEPFYRAPEAQYSPIPGWGLGLSISKEIVERHSGQIWVESSQGKGTTFFVQLPVQVPTEGAGQAS